MKINNDLNEKHILALFCYHRSVRILMQAYRGVDPTVEPDPANRMVSPAVIYLFKHCLELLGKILLVNPTSSKHSLQTYVKHIISEHAEVAFDGDEVTFDFSELEDGKLEEYCKELLQNSKYNEGSVAWLEMLLRLKDSYKVSLRRFHSILRKYDFGDTQNSYYRYMDIELENPMGDFHSYEEIVEEMHDDLPFVDDCVHLVQFILMTGLRDKS